MLVKQNDLSLMAKLKRFKNVYKTYNTLIRQKKKLFVIFFLYFILKTYIKMTKFSVITSHVTY